MCTYLSLPNEVELRILSELPAREIQRCRRVCKHFRDLIDEKSNTTLLFIPGQERARHRLSESLNAATSFEGVDFFDALARWISHRGLWLDGLTRQDVIIRFQRHFTNQNACLPPGRAYAPARNELVWLAQALIALHINAHTDHSVDWKAFSGVADAEAVLKFFFSSRDDVQVGLKSFNVTEETLREYADQIISDPKRLDAPVFPADEYEIPKWPLTAMQYWKTEKKTRFVRRFVFEGFEGVNVPESHSPGLFEFLHIPAIPVKCRPAFAYCVRTEWAHRMACDLTFQGGTAVHGGLGNLKEVQKTAIMEDMYLF